MKPAPYRKTVTQDLSLGSRGSLDLVEALIWANS